MEEVCCLGFASFAPVSWEISCTLVPILLLRNVVIVSS